MTFLVAHAPDGLLAPGGFTGTSHRFLFKIGGRNTTTTLARTSLKGYPIRSTFLQLCLSTWMEIFLAASTFYESHCKAVSIEGSQHATHTYAYVHTPATVADELVSVKDL